MPIYAETSILHEQIGELFLALLDRLRRLDMSPDAEARLCCPDLDARL